MELSQIQETFKELVGDPDERFHKFFDFYCDIKLNSSFSIEKYLRSNREMIRMANIYFKEQDYFHAFVLYSRYVVLYCQKIKSHPQYALGDKVEIGEINKQIKTIAMPRAEKLKTYIKEFFSNEAKDYLARQSQNKPTNSVEQTPSSTKNEIDMEALKMKYNTLNERELREILDREQAEIHNEVAEGPATTSSASRTPSAPTFDRSLKPQSSVSQNRYNLRTIILPGETAKKFLDIAEANTLRNIETCGILAGKLTQNKFIITHCILPKQKGTSDTCSTEHEHELLNVIDNYNLITLGWIHTHPSQTAFLSSIDLHTHYGYQIMLPESIAIVCAPSYDQWVDCLF